MLVQLDDKVKNNFLSSFLIGIDNKFLKLDTADLNESTDYYKNKLNDKVVKKFDGKNFNKLNKKHLTYLADLCKMNLVIFDLDKLDLKFSTDLNKKNKTVYLFKHGKKEYLLMKQNMRGMVSKLPVGIYEQFGGMPEGNKRPRARVPSNEGNNPILNTVNDSQKSNSNLFYNNSISIVPRSPERGKSKRSRIASPSPTHSNNFKYNDEDDDSDEEIGNASANEAAAALAQPPAQPSAPAQPAPPAPPAARTATAAPALKASNIYKYNLVEQIALIQIADIINSLYDLYTKEDSKSSSNDITFDNFTVINKNVENNDENEDVENNNENVSFEKFNNKINLVGSVVNQNGGYLVDYEEEDFKHDFGKSRGEFKLAWNKFFNENKKDPTVNFGEITLNKLVVDEDKILSDAISGFSEENPPFESNLPKIFEEYNNQGLKTKSLSSKIKAIFNNDGKPKDNFADLINLSKQVYYELNADNYKFLQFDQGDTQKILEVPRNNNLSNNIGITILRNIPYLIDGSGSDSISNIVENERWTDNGNYYKDKYIKMFAEGSESKKILTKMGISNIEYYKIGSKYAFKIIKGDDPPFPFSKGFTVNNLLVVMLCVILNINLKEDIENIRNKLLDKVKTNKRSRTPAGDEKKFTTLFENNKDSIKQIIDFINTYDNNNKELRLKVLRLLKFIGDRFQALSVVNDNYDYNNETPYLLSRSILGTGDRVLIAYALKNDIPTIYVSKEQLYLYLPVLIAVGDFKTDGKYKTELVENNLIPNRNPADDKSYPEDLYFEDKTLEEIKFDLCIRLFKNKINSQFLEDLKEKTNVPVPELEENEKRSIYIDILSDLTKDISDNSDIPFIPILLEYIEEISREDFDNSFSDILIHILNNKIFINNSKHTPKVNYNISNMKNFKKYTNDDGSNFQQPYQNKGILSLAYIKNNNVIEEEEDFKNYRIKLNQYGLYPGKTAEAAHLVTTYINFIDQLIAKVNEKALEEPDFFENEKEKLIELKQKAQEDINYHKKIQDKLEGCFNDNDNAKIIFNKSKIVDYFEKLNDDENEETEKKALYETILRNLKENESMDED